MGADGERVIRFRLDREKLPDILEQLAGPCAARPENRNCGYIPISRVNTVQPDAAGNIDLRVEEPFVLDAETAIARSTLLLDFAVGLGETCARLKAARYPDPFGSLPGALEDQSDPDEHWYSVEA